MLNDVNYKAYNICILLSKHMLTHALFLHSLQVFHWSWEATMWGSPL